MGGAYRTCGRDEKCIQILVGKPEEKRPFGIHRRRCEDNIRIDVGEKGRGEGVEWMHLAQNRN
jgi:hypothetical protein